MLTGKRAHGSEFHVKLMNINKQKKGMLINPSENTQSY